VPFHGHPFNIATDTIEAEDFDNGGEGVAYHDTTPQNILGKYRNTGVDIGAVSNASNGFAVGYSAPGEWLNYTISAPASGSFAIQARVASFRQGGTFHVEIDGVNVTGTMTIPDTGPWDTWQTITSAAFNVSAGTHGMRVVMDRGGYWGAIGDFDSFRFTPAPAPPAGPTPFLGHPLNIATDSIEAENFDNGGEGIAYHDTTPANLGGKYRNTAVDISAGGSHGYCVGYTAPGEWLRYSITVPAAGSYALAARVAFLGPGGTFHMEIDGANVSGTMTVPNTGGWLNWQTVTSGAFQLSAGTHAMRIVMDHGGSYGAIGDFDSFRFAPVTTPPPINYTWTTAAPAPLGLTEAESAVVGNKMYVFGGYFTTFPNYLATARAEAYDLASNRWSAIADVPSPFTHGGCTADGRYVYLAGGYISNYSTGQQTFATKNTWRYDTITNTWSAMTPLPQARGTGALALVGRTLHFFGGVDINRVDRADHWTLNLDDPTATWQVSTPLPSVRNHLGATVLNGKIYAIGGQVGENDNNPISTCLVFDPATNQWSSIANLPAPRSHIAGDTFVMNGKVVIVAGVSTGGAIVGNVTAYDPATNTWQDLKPLPQPRHSSVAKFVNGHLVAATGYWNGLRTDTWVSSLIS
jgi:N-acetylneuraminic acid mutarotase